MKQNVLNEKCEVKNTGKKNCKMKFRTVKTAVANRFGEGERFSILAYKWTVKVTDGISANLCHTVQN